MNRIFVDQLNGIEFIAVSPGARIEISKNTPHQIVRDSSTQDDVGIVIFNGNRNSFPYRINENDSAYLFWKGSNQTVAFNTYSN